MRRAHRTRRKATARRPITPRGPRWWHYLLVLLLAVAAAALALAALTHDYSADARGSASPESALVAAQGPSTGPVTAAVFSGEHDQARG